MRYALASCRTSPSWADVSISVCCVNAMPFMHLVVLPRRGPLPHLAAAGSLNDTMPTRVLSPAEENAARILLYLNPPLAVKARQ